LLSHAFMYSVAGCRCFGLRDMLPLWNARYNASAHDLENLTAGDDGDMLAPMALVVDHNAVREDFCESLLAAPVALDEPATTRAISFA